jgi:hypothetical protein
VDPEVFFKLQLVMFFEGIRSERRLMEVAADRLSALVPGLRPIRDPTGPLQLDQDLRALWPRGLQELLRESRRDVRRGGLVWGKELYFDATKVDADA